MPLVSQKKEAEAIDWIGVSPLAGTFHYLCPSLEEAKGRGGGREERRAGELGPRRVTLACAFPLLGAAAGELASPQLPPPQGLRWSEVNIAACFLFRLRRAKLAVYQTYMPGTVVSAFAGVSAFEPQEQ